MTAIFLGGIKNLLHRDKGSENAVARITNNLGKSNLGLHKADAGSVSGSPSPGSEKDSFDIAQHISDLLSPACGMTEEEKESYYNKIMEKLKSGKKLSAQEIFADSLSHVADDDPMKEYIVAAYQDAMKNFEKSDEYKELPETEEDAKQQNS